MNSPKVGIGVLIFDTQQRILLGKRKNAHGENTWGPPGGHLEWYETFQECAIREVHEETGLRINDPQVIGVTNDIFIENDKHYVSVFLCVICPIDQLVQNLEPQKVLNWEWFTLSNMPMNLFLPLKNLIKNIGKKNLFRLSISSQECVYPEPIALKE